MNDTPEAVPVPHEPRTEVTPRARVLAQQLNNINPALIQLGIDKGWIR